MYHMYIVSPETVTTRGESSGSGSRGEASVKTLGVDEADKATFNKAD